MLPNILSRLIILLFGALFPAYKSYKAIKYKNVKEVVRLTMHWIVFSMFLVLETVADLIIFWLPFYYEVKCLLVLYLVLPFTQGSSIIYRKIVHPNLNRKELEIDEAIENATETGFMALKKYGSKGFTYAAAAIINTALMGQDLIVNHLRNRSISMDDLFFRKSNDDAKPSSFQTGNLGNPENKYLRKSSAPSLGQDSLDYSQPRKALPFNHQLLAPNPVLYDLRELEEDEESLSRSPSQASQHSHSSYNNSGKSAKSGMVVSRLVLPTKLREQRVVHYVTQTSSASEEDAAAQTFSSAKTVQPPTV